MSLQIIKGDITQIAVDAIVNPTDEYYSGSGGTDFVIHRAAGPELRKTCDALPFGETGKVAVTPGFELPSKYVFHTVGPRWSGGQAGEYAQLCSCYSNALAMAQQMKLSTIAFPLLASGTFQYPKKEAIDAATKTIRKFLEAHEMVVYLVVFDREALRISYERYGEIQSILDLLPDRGTSTARLKEPVRYREYLHRIIPRDEVESDALSENDNGIVDYEEELRREDERTIRAEEADYPLLATRMPISESPKEENAPDLGGSGLWRDELIMPVAEAYRRPIDELQSLLKGKDESFAQALVRMIDERGMKDAQLYKKANVDKQLFNKIKNRKGYRPQKSTVVALAFALEPTRAELNDLITKAGYSFSMNNDFDIIINYCFDHGILDILEVNDLLFQFDQPLLGSIAKESA